MASNVTTTLSIRDNYTAVIKKARSYTKAFEKDVKTMTGRLDNAGKKKLELNVKNSAAMKALSAVEKKIAPIRNVMVKVTANAAQFKNQIRPVESTFKKITGKAWTVTWKVKDGVTAAVTKIGSALKKVGNVAGTIGNTVFSAGSYAIGRGMEHNQYVTDVPYKTGKVIRTGMKADQIKKGNTLAPQGLAKMAVRASNKDFIEAMEFRTGAQEVKHDGPAAFGGGADKLAKNTANLISVVAGRLKSKTAENGLHGEQKTMPFIMRAPDTVVRSTKGSLFTPAYGTGNTGGAAITTALQSRDMLQFSTDTNHKAWENLSNTMPDVNNISNAVKLGNNLMPVGTVSKTSGSGSSASGSSGETPAKDNKDDFWSLLGKMSDAFGVFQLVGKGIDLINHPDKYPKTMEIAKGAWTAIKSYGTGVVEAIAAAKAAEAAAAAAANEAITAASVASPIIQKVIETGSSALAYAGPALMPGVYYWWQDQKSLASYDYWEKTGGKDFDKAPLGDKAAVWLNRALPGLNGWTPPGLVNGLNNLSNGTYTKMASDGFNLMLTHPDEANANFKKNLGILFGGAPKPVNDTKDSSVGKGNSSKYTPWNLETLRSYQDQVRKHGGVNLGSVHPATQAAGIKRVPFDNYPALLHKGEAVLPSGEAGEYRRQGNMGGRAANNISLNISVNGGSMDENRLASILVNKLQEVALNMA